jgi:replicative DNA helicase
MTDFKESGAIEYGSDVLIGLHFKGAGQPGFDLETAYNNDPREVELKILKNREGKPGQRIAYNFYPKFNYFEEVD